MKRRARQRHGNGPGAELPGLAGLFRRRHDAAREARAPAFLLRARCLRIGPRGQRGAEADGKTQRERQCFTGCLHRLSSSSKVWMTNETTGTAGTTRSVRRP
ncbi:hypothetical protein BMAPRL20_0521 [Burkholderia mallei PRL-20]|nr:hypothetical protein BURPSS13_C0149 [Burkholderia pseudomallei S13]EES43273.1 hypothetical protein BMAPRL20_0521 [Burkholderia mallei PRL-20]